jgi:hypothetical protein
MSLRNAAMSAVVDDSDDEEDDDYVQSNKRALEEQEEPPSDFFDEEDEEDEEEEEEEEEESIPPPKKKKKKKDEEEEESVIHADMFHSMVTKHGRIDAWALGRGVVVEPPPNNTPLTATGWALWANEMRVVPHVHLAMNMVDSLMDPSRVGVFKSSDKEAINARNSSMAAIFGAFFDYHALGMFFDGHRLYPSENELPGGPTPHLRELSEDDRKRRKKAIHEMGPLPFYQFTHHYPAVCVKAPPGSVEEWIECPTDRIFSYTDDRMNKHGISDQLRRQIGGVNSEVKHCTTIAACEIFVMETLYGRPKVQPEEGADPRGPVVGVRAHTLHINPHMRSCEYVAKLIRQNQNNWRHARATLCEDEKRGEISNKAGKATRAWVADQDVEKTSLMKWAGLTDNVALTQALLQCGGEGCGGQTRHIYPDMNIEFGAGAATTPINEHTTETQHALAPEAAFNFRDGCRCYSSHPDYARHKLDNPKIYKKQGDAPTDGQADTRPYKQCPTRVANAFMVSQEGIPIELMPEQEDANNYFDDDGAVCFPFPETCYILVNPLRSKRDSTLPNRISTVPQVGNDALLAFYEAKKSEAVVQASVANTRAVMAKNNLASQGNYDPTIPEISAEVERLRQNNLPSEDEIVRHLMPVFTDMLCPSTTQSAISKRLQAGRHVQPDSLDQTAADVAAKSKSFNVGFTYESKVEMKDAKLAMELTKVHDVLMEGAAKLEDRGREDFKYRVKTQLIEWFVRCFDEMYQNPRNSASVWPNHLKVWKTTMRLIEMLPEAAKKHMQAKKKAPAAEVDQSNPHSHRGSANIAFLYNNYMTKSGISAYGNYQSDVLSFLYYEVCGILGASNHIRNALHMLPYFASCPHGFRPILVINGKPGMCKSAAVERFGFVWNRPDNPEITRSFFFASGAGSDKSWQAGEISPASGGVQTYDEPPNVFTSSATKDEALNQQRQSMKEACTNLKTSRARCEQVVDADGQQHYIRKEYEMQVNHPLCLCSNLGAATLTEFKPRANDGKALEHRMICLLSAESIPPGVTPKGNDTIKDDLEEHQNLLNTHTLVTSLTQMCLAMASVLKCLRPPREDLMIKTLAALDDFVEKNYGNSKPDARRLELRRHEAMAKAFEAAVVRIFVYKEEAVNFDHMLPVSSADETTHTLAPFNLSHLVPIFQLACYDMEVILDTWSSGLDRSLYTAPDMHHILLAIGKLHGIDPNPLKSKFNNNGMREEQVDADRAPNAAAMQRNYVPPANSLSQPAEDREQARAGLDLANVERTRGELDLMDVDFSVGRGYDDGSQTRHDEGGGLSEEQFNTINASVEANKQQRRDERQRESQPVLGRPAEPTGDGTPRQTTTQPSSQQGAQTALDRANSEFKADTEFEAEQKSAANKICFEHMNEFSPQEAVPETILTDRMQIMRKRHRLMQYALRLRKTMDLNKLKSDATHHDIVSETLKAAPKDSGGDIILPWKDNGNENVITIKEFCSITLPVVGEVISSGYHEDDLRCWLGGTGSAHRFNSKDAENVFMGVHTNSFVFEKRPGARNTALGCDIAWRTCIGNDPASAIALAKPDESEGAGSGAAGSSSGARRSVTIEDTVKGISNNAERKQYLDPFKVDMQHIFDRIFQIINATQDDFRTLCVSPSTDVLRSKGPLRANHRSVLRVFDTLLVSKFRKSDEIDREMSFASIDDTLTLRNIIPYQAVDWTRRKLDDASASSDCERSEKHELIVGSVKDPSVQRLDQLLQHRALPAADMALSDVVRGNPIKSVGNTMFINGPFFIEQARLNQEIDVTLLTIAGLRSPVVCNKTNSSDSETESALQLADAVATEIAARPNKQITDKDAIRCLKACFYSAKHSDSVMSNPKDGKNTELFEKIGIFFTHAAHSQFDWADPPLQKTYIENFRDVYPTTEAIQSKSSETITRFFQRISDKRYEKNPKRLSFQHSFFSATTAAETGRIDEEDVTEEECIAADEMHFNMHGYHVFDEQDRKMLALTLRGSKMNGSDSFLQRKTWRAETLHAKLETGMISKKDKFFSAVVAATSTNLLVNVMAHVAITGKECKVDTINMRSAYLRPMKHQAATGTCRSDEIGRIRMFLAEKVDAKCGSKDKFFKSPNAIHSKRSSANALDPNVGTGF